MQNKQAISLIAIHNRFSEAVRKLTRDRRGVEFVEVLIVLGFVAFVGMAGFQTLGTKINEAAGTKASGKVDQIPLQ